MNGKGWLQVTREWSTQLILLLYSWYYSRFCSLSKLFYARPRYQKQRRHDKTNSPNWRGTWQVRCKRAHALWQNSSHARSMSSQGRARYIAVRKLILRALVLVSWMHYSWDGAQEFFFQTYSSDKPGGRVERKTLERVSVCILSSRMSYVFNAERTRQRGLLKNKNLRRVKIDIS